MHELIAGASHYVEIHLLYASIVGLAALALTSILRASATTKYWIWVATSLNFALPMSTVLDGFRAPHPSWTTKLNAIGGISNGVSPNTTAVLALWVVWSLGTLLMFTRLCMRIRADHRRDRAAGPSGDHDSKLRFLASGVPVRFAGSGRAPAVDGVLRPHISLPEGIDRLLSSRELDAVLIHEIAHARRGDNLIRLIHEVALCGLWFHPLVWIAGSRLALYRELSCDESVIESSNGGHLVSALAKLAGAEEQLLLQASASSFITHRLARLTAAQPPRTALVANALLSAFFGAALLAGVLGTAAQTVGSSRLAAVAYAPCEPDLLQQKHLTPPPRARTHTRVGVPTTHSGVP